MGLVSKVMDNFKTAEISIDPNMKVKIFQQKFKEIFGVTLRIYNGVAFADSNQTLSSIKSFNPKNNSIKIKATMTVLEVEEIFQSSFGLKVQIADRNNTHLVPNTITIGEARRGEYDLNKQK